MALRIRLQRFGAKNHPAYRVVVAEAAMRRDGRFVEILGSYDPIAKDKSSKVKMDVERADYWVSKGAQPTDTVRHLMRVSRRAS